MGRRPGARGHPLLREVVLERRALLRSLGAGAAGAALLGVGAVAGCGGGDDGEKGGQASQGRGRDRGGGAARRSGEPAESVRPYDPDRPYWQQGNFAAVDREVTETRLEVSGAIPPALSGLYVRNGSNPVGGRSTHWFDGDGMVHGVRIEAGRARWYRNRWVATTSLRRERSPAGDQGGAPGADVNDSNVALTWYDGRLLSLGEVGWPYEIAPGDLSTVGPWNFDGRLTTAMTAHPKVDPDTGSMHFFGYGFADPLLTYHVADAGGRLVHSEPVAIDAPMMVHDFAITDRDAVFWLGPLMFGFQPGMMHPDFPFYWDAERPTRIGIMPLGGPASAIRWVEAEPCFVFHGLSAHRDGDEVVLRVNRLPSVFGTEPDFAPTYLTEWRIDTGGADLRLREEQLSDVSMDMPTIDRRRTGRPVRHGWCTTTTVDDTYGWGFAGLNHVDLRTGREDRWEPGPLEVADEGLFVPADEAGEAGAGAGGGAGGGAGDDGGEGWLLTYLYDRTVDRSSLAIFDAQDVAAGPVARIHLPVRVPHGFHGLWLPEPAL